MLQPALLIATCIFLFCLQYYIAWMLKVALLLLLLLLLLLPLSAGAPCGHAV
jgi:hypothetical protein